MTKLPMFAIVRVYLLLEFIYATCAGQWLPFNCIGVARVPPYPDQLFCGMSNERVTVLGLREQCQTCGGEDMCSGKNGRYQDYPGILMVS